MNLPIIAVIYLGIKPGYLGTQQFDAGGVSDYGSGGGSGIGRAHGITFAAPFAAYMASECRSACATMLCAFTGR